MLTMRLREVESVIAQMRLFLIDRPKDEVDMYLEPLMAYRYYLLTKIEGQGCTSCEGGISG